jgi:hypothetical protein
MVYIGYEALSFKTHFHVKFAEQIFQVSTSIFHNDWCLISEPACPSVTESRFLTFIIQYLNLKTSDKAAYVHKLCRPRVFIHAKSSIGFQVFVGVLIIQIYVRDRITENGFDF